MRHAKDVPGIVQSVRMGSRVIAALRGVYFRRERNHASVLRVSSCLRGLKSARIVARIVPNATA